MPLHLDIKRQLTTRSDRVKCVDFHPTEPWMLTSLYNGNVFIWNYETEKMIKTFEVSASPVRASKFISRKSWIINGADDMNITVYNYNTSEKVIAFEAHSDYVRSIAVHPTRPYVLSASDDMTIKLWDWENAWANVMVFEGHMNFIMQVVFNPKDTNTFASACLDKTIKVWSLGSPVANFTLEGHTEGVNCVEYYQGGEKPYIVSGSDDRTVKVWDYQNKTCVQTLEGHTENVDAVCFHPELPLIISGGDDGNLCLWHSNTYRLENKLNYGLERIWSICYLKGNNNVGVAYDNGAICMKLGCEEPAISMDSSGKIIWAKHNNIQTTNTKTNMDENVKDGEKLQLSVKDLGSCEIYPHTLSHSPNGRFVAVCGDGEYIIYTALAWRNKSYGSAIEFVWAMDSNEYAIIDSTSHVKMFKNFKEKDIVINTPFNVEKINGGTLLSVQGSGLLNFYSWETGDCIRCMETVAKNVYWSESDLVVIECEESFYILRYDRLAYQRAIDQNIQIGPEGVEEAFVLLSEVNESVKAGFWVGDSFVYINSANRLNFTVGTQTNTIAFFDQNMYLLGYIPRDNRIYLTDKDINIYSYLLPQSIIEYETAILREDFDSANLILPNIPTEHLNKIAIFLESQKLYEMAMNISTDPEHKFTLSLQLKKLDIAFEIAKEIDQESTWKTLSEEALNSWNFDLTEKCLKNAKDYENLLMFYQASGNLEGIKELGELTEKIGKNNVAFLCYLLANDLKRCTDILLKTEKTTEAVLFGHTYMPSTVPELVAKWKETLIKNNSNNIAKALTDPEQNPELFPDYKYSLMAQNAFQMQNEAGIKWKANEYMKYKDSLNWDMISAMKIKTQEDNKNEVSNSQESTNIEDTTSPVQTEPVASSPTDLETN